MVLSTAAFDTPPAHPDLRLAEAHHRISNSLQLIASLLRLEAAEVAKRGVPVAPEDVRVALEDGAARVGTVALLHRLLSQAPDDGRVDIAVYLGEISNNLATALSFVGELDLSGLTADTWCIEADKAVPLGMVVSELVTNSIKYAHPAGVAGRIDVNCHRTFEGPYRIEIADDGVGLPEGFDPKKDGGLGFQVVRALCKQLGARVTFKSRGTGLSVYLDISA